jgi:hypothetical protein
MKSNGCYAHRDGASVDATVGGDISAEPWPLCRNAFISGGRAASSVEVIAIRRHRHRRHRHRRQFLLRHRRCLGTVLRQDQ